MKHFSTTDRAAEVLTLLLSDLAVGNKLHSLYIGRNNTFFERPSPLVLEYRRDKITAEILCKRFYEWRDYYFSVANWFNKARTDERVEEIIEHAAFEVLNGRRCGSEHHHHLRKFHQAVVRRQQQTIQNLTRLVAAERQMNRVEIEALEHEIRATRTMASNTQRSLFHYFIQKLAIATGRPQWTVAFKYTPGTFLTTDDPHNAYDYARVAIKNSEAFDIYYHQPRLRQPYRAGTRDLPDVQQMLLRDLSIAAGRENLAESEEFVALHRHEDAIRTALTTKIKTSADVGPSEGQ